MRSFAAAVTVLIALAGPAVGQTTVAISCGAVGADFALCREGAEAWARQTGNRVRMVYAPDNASERLALYQQLLAARSGDIDVLQIDVVWPGILANHLTDLSGHFNGTTLDQHFAAIVQNNTVAGQLVAVPWFTGVGLLYYRRDLLQKYGHPDPPETWEEMAEIARIVMTGEHKTGNGRMWGYVFQGRAYEGLTVNALEWLVSREAGSIVEPNCRITVNNPRAAEALTLVASWVGKIAPRGVLNYTEEEARGVFQSGNAVFMRNWPYAWPLLNAEGSTVRNKVGVAMLPRGGPGGRHAAALGGGQLAVSRYSRSPEVAISLVRYLIGRAEQKRRAIEGGFNPTIEGLYEDPEVLRANPFFRELYKAFVQAVARPSSIMEARYEEVSAEFRTTVQTILSGRGDARSELGRLERRLRRICEQ